MVSTSTCTNARRAAEANQTLVLAGELGDFRLKKSGRHMACGPGERWYLPGLRSRSAQFVMGLELIANLVGPETLQADQSLVQQLEIFGINAANLLQ